ncbi:hypothetical protein [Deinococcus cellulosilyticus]|uniref:hypothetical protein n=1 Tax=Deinococcus cellulosilyticus TaxID=401558 RepID=UPI0011BFE325|nr:hypothetical protein [Deinococcus cellulosilyticus]
MTARFKRHFLTCATLFLLGSALAACPEKDLSLEDESLGVIYADDLDAGEEQTVFSGACFTLGGLDLSTPSITIKGGAFSSEVLTVSGDGVSGTVQKLSGTPDQRTLTGVKLTLTLPSGVLNNVPLETGTYLLEGEATQSAEVWHFERAVLTRQDGRAEKYALEDADLKEGRLSAKEARLVQDLNQLKASGVSGTEQQVQAAQVEFCVCRDLDARELLVQGEDLQVTPATFAVRSVRFHAYGLQTPSLGSLELPLDPEKPLLAAVQEAFEDYQAKLEQKPVGVVSASGSVALKNLPVTLDLDTRLNLGVHTLQQGTVPEVLLDRETADLRLQVGLAAPVNGESSSPSLLFDAAPSSGPALRAHFRVGAQDTSEIGAGYSFRTGDFRLLALASFAQENGQTAPVYALEGLYRGEINSGNFTLKADTRLRLQSTLGDVAFVHDGFYLVGYQQGPWSAEVQHTLGTQAGDVHFRAFLPEQRNQTRLTVQYAPENWSARYSLMQDWQNAQTMNGVLVTTAVLELEGQTRYDAKAERWLNLSLNVTPLIVLTPDFRAEPMLGYDWASGSVLYGLGGTFYTSNYAYTLGLYHRSEGWGLKARVALR